MDGDRAPTSTPMMVVATSRWRWPRPSSKRWRLLPSTYPRANPYGGYRPQKMADMFWQMDGYIEQII